MSKEVLKVVQSLQELGCEKGRRVYIWSLLECTWRSCPIDRLRGSNRGVETRIGPWAQLELGTSAYVQSSVDRWLG